MIVRYRTYLLICFSRIWILPIFILEIWIYKSLFIWKTSQFVIVVPIFFLCHAVENVFLFLQHEAYFQFFWNLLLINIYFLPSALNAHCLSCKVYKSRYTVPVLLFSFFPCKSLKISRHVVNIQKQHFIIKLPTNCLVYYFYFLYFNQWNRVRKRFKERCRITIPIFFKLI